MDWETSKENFQPLKQGRHLTKELKPLAKAPATDQGSAEQERKYDDLTYALCPPSPKPERTT